MIYIYRDQNDVGFTSSLLQPSYLKRQAPESIADRLSLNRVNSGTCIVLTFRIRVHERVRQEIRPKLVRRRYEEGGLNETPARTINPATWKTMNGFTECRALLIIRLLRRDVSVRGADETTREIRPRNKKRKGRRAEEHEWRKR